MSRTASPESIARKEQKAYEERKLITKNRCLSRFSLMNKRTLHLQLHEVGYTDIHIRGLYPDDKPITIKDINESFEKWWTDLEAAHQIIPQPVIEPVVVIKAPSVLDKIVEPTPINDKCLPESPRMKCVMFPFQDRAAWEMAQKLYVEKKRAVLLRAAVGTGKTFIVARELLYAKEHNLVPESFGLFPVLYITKSTVVEQTQRVLENLFGLTIDDVFVTNIESLRTQKFQWAIKREVKVENGQEHEIITWRVCHPAKIYWDECHGLKNEDSIQSRISQAFNDVAGDTVQVFFSATPFLRVCECKCFAVATKLPVRFGAGIKPLSNDMWPSFAKEVAAPADPIEFCEAAVKRLMSQLHPYIVDVKGVRSQFNAQNTTRLVSFKNEEQRTHYETAWENYLKKKAKIESMEGLPGGQFLILAQFTIFRRAAEWSHAENFADMMADAERQGFAPVAAVSFKQTIIRIVKFLITKHGYSRDDISLIWGGGQQKATKKQLIKQKMLAKADLLRECGITLEDFDLDTIEDFSEEKVEPSWRLGTQALPERQSEIDKFQSGRSKFCCYTFKAGGVGLSLHHSDELTKQKARRKKNGWYVEEDIPQIPTRPRMTFLTPTYSAIELVQGLGRAPRLTSMSNTIQTILFFRGTIEERVAAIVSQKLRCLRHVTRTKESWEDAIVGAKPNANEYDDDPQQAKLLELKPMPDDDDDDGEGGMFISGDEDED